MAKPPIGPPSTKPLDTESKKADPFTNLPIGIQKLYENNPAKKRHKIVMSDYEVHEGWIEQCKTEKRTIVE